MAIPDALVHIAGNACADTDLTDTPLTLRGYVTDPQRAGYQILTNYESTYWRALVGSDAWSLYEVLRSFCHKGHDSCHPSVSLLLAVLGLKDRSTLIGRPKPKIVNGTAYTYPGLIQVLQDHDLLVAETSGERATLRYTFHVNLTPGLLTADQVRRLPDLLQSKHADLLQQAATQHEQLQAKKQPSKVAPQGGSAGMGNSETPALAGIGDSHNPGSAPIGNSGEGIGNSNRGYRNFPHEQQPMNITQGTERARGQSNNSIEPVVVALTAHGLAPRVARQLAESHDAATIAQKIAYLDHLLATRPDQVKNPHGWLRKAIEHDYAPPVGFGAADAETADAHRRRRYLDLDPAVPATQAAFDLHAPDEGAGEEAPLPASDPDLAALWQQALREFQATLRPDLYALVAGAQALTLDGESLRIGAVRADDWRALQHPNLTRALERTLADLAGRPVRVTCEQLAAAEALS